MFQVQAPVVVTPSVEARDALGAQLKPAALAAWREIGRRGEGIEYAHFQIDWNGVTLAVASRVRPNGFIELEIGLGDPRQAARVVTGAQYRAAAARVPGRGGRR